MSNKVWLNNSGTRKKSCHMQPIILQLDVIGCHLIGHACDYKINIIY
jgi:hypothetical protein